MLSIIHVINEKESRVPKDHRRSKEISFNNKKVRKVFEDFSHKTIPIPIIINDYNYNISSIDVTD